MRGDYLEERASQGGEGRVGSYTRGNGGSRYRLCFALNRGNTVFTIAN
jgi:hypothetical protein